MVDVVGRVAGAPISWGVCEVQGWGYQLDADVVLRQMRELGLTATEFGPDGFLPADPKTRAATLAAAGLQAVGGFFPVLLHDPDFDPLPQVAAALDGLVESGAHVLVLAASTGLADYDGRPALDDAAWEGLLANLDRVGELSAGRGVVTALHPHVGTMVERRGEVERVLAGCEVSLCVDTGHLIIGGTDPVELVHSAGSRIAHVHLKDVDAGWAARVRSGAVTYAQAVAGGMYLPLGAGAGRIAETVRLLEVGGYGGWYVMEQDAVLAGPPDDDRPPADVRASLHFLRGLA